MAINNSRSMIDEFSQGIIDNTYSALTPNRGGEIENPPYDRLTWPGFQQVEQHQVDPFTQSMQHHSQRPVERKVCY